MKFTIPAFENPLYCGSVNETYCCLLSVPTLAFQIPRVQCLSRCLSLSFYSSFNCYFFSTHGKKKKKEKEKKKKTEKKKNTKTTEQKKKKE